FKAAAEAVHTAHAPSFRNDKHKAQWINTLTEYVFPVFGDRQVNQIETGDVLNALSPIWLTKPETARRVRQRIKLVFDWCKAKGYRTGDNPVESITRTLPKQQTNHAHHAALPYADVPAFIADLQQAN